MSYVRGKGFPEVATRDSNGNYIEPFLNLGDTSLFEAQFSDEGLAIYDSINGTIHQTDKINYKLAAKIKIQIRQFNAENLALCLAGKITERAPVVVTVPEVLVNNIPIYAETQLLNKGRVVSLVLVDANNQPLVENVNYHHNGFGRIKILNVNGKTQPFKATYKALKLKKISIGNLQTVDLWIRFWQNNIAVRSNDNSIERRCYEFYKVRLSMADVLSLMQQNEASEVTLNGTLLLDTTKTHNVDFSAYGNAYIFNGDLSLPSMTSMLSLTNITNSSITANWLAGENASEYDLIVKFAN